MPVRAQIWSRMKTIPARRIQFRSGWSGSATIGSRSLSEVWELKNSLHQRKTLFQRRRHTRSSSGNLAVFQVNVKSTFKTALNCSMQPHYLSQFQYYVYTVSQNEAQDKAYERYGHHWEVDQPSYIMVFSCGSHIEEEWYSWDMWRFHAAQQGSPTKEPSRQYPLQRAHSSNSQVPRLS